MLRYLIERQIKAQEKNLGVGLEYLRQIARVSIAELLGMNRLARLMNERNTLAPAPFHVARLVAVLAEDCGDCVRIEANLARQADVPADVVRAVLDLRPSDLPEDLGDVYLFAECTVQNAGDAEPLRSRIRSRYGERGLIEMVRAIALARTFPVIKRGLGYATSCQRQAIKVS